MAARHLQWDDLARFAKRLIVINSSLIEPKKVTTNLIDDTFKRAMAYAHSTTADPQSPPSEAQPRLHHFLGTSRALINAGSPLEGVPEVALPFRQELDRQLSTPVCSDCSKRACDGSNSDSDQKNLSDRGKCLTTIRSIFDAVIELALRAYDKPRRQILLGTSHLEKLPSGAVPLAFVGRTREAQPNSSSGERHVQLSVHIDQFEQRDFFALPYVIFHEVFCHAFSGIELQVDAKADAFSEGWMDWVGTQALVNDLRSGNVPAVLGRYSLYMADAAQLVSNERYASAGTPGGGVQNRFDMGRKAVQLLHRLFAGICGHEGEAFKYLLTFSAKVNASHMTGGKRAELVTGCLMGLPDNATPLESFQRAPKSLVKVIQRYFRTGNHLEMAQDLCAFSKI